MKKYPEAKNNNNAGFTLIEAVTALAVSVLVLSAVAFFLSTGVRQYISVNAGVSVQIESQTALEHTAELIREAIDPPQQTDVSGCTVYAFRMPQGRELLILERESGYLMSVSQTEEQTVTAAGKLIPVSEDVVKDAVENYHKYLIAALVDTVELSQAGSGSKLIDVRVVTSRSGKSSEVSGSYFLRNAAMGELAGNSAA